MNFKRLRNHEEPKLMMIPMIDIIFFLLVFFMMSTLYAYDQRIIQVQLPQATSHQWQADGSIAVLVLSDGDVVVNEEKISVQLLRELVRKELSVHPQTAFVLYSDASTEYGMVVTAMDELKMAGVSKLAIAAKRKEM